MDWQRHFQAIFFETWQKAGLPHHKDCLPEYYQMLQQQDFKNEWIEKSSCISLGINQVQLYAVYNFGVAVGKIFNEMLGLGTTHTQHTSDWCGRFNLGISLFDYISDELGAVNRVASLEVFQPFLHADNSGNPLLTPAEQLLSNLVGSVLDDLKKATSKKEGSHKTGLLFNVLQQLFEAENFVSKEVLSVKADLKKIDKALYLKSAEPFRVMAEYIALMADTDDPLIIKNARSIGKAVGYCYWLIDDAKDVWIDLEAGKWNLFLQLAAAEDPQIFAQHPDAFTSNRLVSIWEHANHAEKIAVQIIKRLVHAIDKLGLSKKEEHHTLGLVAASLWQWYHC